MSAECSSFGVPYLNPKAAGHFHARRCYLLLNGYGREQYTPPPLTESQSLNGHLTDNHPLSIISVEILAENLHPTSVVHLRAGDRKIERMKALASALLNDAACIYWSGCPPPRLEDPITTDVDADSHMLASNGEFIK